MQCAGCLSFAEDCKYQAFCGHKICYECANNQFNPNEDCHHCVSEKEKTKIIAAAASSSSSQIQEIKSMFMEIKKELADIKQ